MPWVLLIILFIYYIIPLSPPKWYFWMVLHSVTLWTGAWESGSGWGLGVPNYFGGPWAITLCNTPKNLPTLVLAPSLCVRGGWTGRRSQAPTGDFTVAFGHGHPLVLYIITTCVCVRLCVRRRFRVLIDAVEPARTVGFGKTGGQTGRGRGQGRVRLSVCLAGQGRGQGRAGRAGAK